MSAKRSELKEINEILSRYSADELDDIRCKILYSCSCLGVSRVADICKSFADLEEHVRGFAKLNKLVLWAKKNGIPTN